MLSNIISELFAPTFIISVILGVVIHAATHLTLKDISLVAYTPQPRPRCPSKAAQYFPGVSTPNVVSSLLTTSRLVVMSEDPHVPTRHSDLGENSIPFPHAPSISRQSLSLTSNDIEGIGYSYSQAYANLSHDSSATYHARLSRTPAGSIRSTRGRPGPQQLSPVVEENEERRRSRGSRSYTSSPPATHLSLIPISLSEPPTVFPEDMTEAIMSLLPRVEARTAAITRPRRSKILRVLMPMKRLAKLAGGAISGAAKAIPTYCLKHRY